MAYEIDNHPELDEQPQGGRWLRKLGILAGVLLALLVTAYFTATSSAFLKGVVLPRAGQSLNAVITADDISLSPFSRLELKKFSLKTGGAEPVFTAEEVRVRYSLMAILGGSIEVSEITLLSPEIRIVQEADGRSNLDPILNQPSRGTSAPSKEPIKLAVQNISLKNGKVHLVKNEKSGARQTVDVTGIQLALDRFQNGQAGKLTLEALLNVLQSAATGAKTANDTLEAKVSGAFDFAMNPQLLPKEAKGNTRLVISRAEGVYGGAKNVSVELRTDLTPAEIREVALRIERDGKRLGQAVVSGPFDLVKKEARLKLDVQSIDREVLNTLSAGKGIDFGSSTLSASLVADLSQNWNFIALNGKLGGRQLTVIQSGQAAPPLDLDAEYDAQIKVAEQTAIVQKLNLLGKQKGREFLTASLDKPMNVSWSPKAQGFAESNFRLALQQFDLAEWRALAGTNAPSAGLLDLKLDVLAQNDAKQLTASLAATVTNLAVQAGTNRIAHALVKMEAQGGLQDFRIAALKQFTAAIQQEGKPLVQAEGSANYDLEKKQLNAQFGVDLALPALLRQFPVPGLQVSNGAAKLNASYSDAAGQRAITGSASLGDFDGGWGAYRFDRFQAAVEFNTALRGADLQIHRASLALRQGYENGGSLDLSGAVNLTNSAAQITFKASDFNQHALRPFLAPALGGKKLVSISLSAEGTAGYNPAGESAIQGGINLANWVVHDPLQPAPEAPLAARLQLNGSLRGQLLDLRECVLNLTPTERAKNELRLQAKLNLNSTNTAPGMVTLAAESIDATPYYDLFAGKTNAPAAVAAPSKPSTGEPAPVTLPFADLTATAKIDRFFLREIAITNFNTAVKIQKSQVSVKPLQFALNGAPVSAEAALNLGVPGFGYDLTFQAARVPVEPLANSFSTNRAGALKGDFNASAKIKGTGITGTNLRKNLDGQVAFALTNMNLAIVGAKTRRLVEPVALVLGLQELLQSPLNWVDARMNLGQGRIELSKFGVLSSAFYAESQGSIPIADVLTNSPIDLPVNLSLRRGLAEKANLVPANSPTNTAYVALPAFVKVTGTLGEPKTQTDKLVIAGLVARSAVRFIPAAESKAGNILQGVGNLLTGQGASAPKAAAPTNAPPSPTPPPAVQPASPAADLIQGIGGLLRSRSKPAATNPPATPKPATNPPASTPSAPKK